MGSDPQQMFAMDIIRTDASLAIHRRNGHAKLPLVWLAGSFILWNYLNALKYLYLILSTPNRSGFSLSAYITLLLKRKTAKSQRGTHVRVYIKATGIEIETYYYWGTIQNLCSFHTRDEINNWVRHEGLIAVTCLKTKVLVAIWTETRHPHSH